VATLSRWAVNEPRLLEVDLNPVLVKRTGHGAVALDALVVIGQDERLTSSA
jgi:hypothetical protein